MRIDALMRLRWQAPYPIEIIGITIVFGLKWQDFVLASIGTSTTR